jgi:putative endonuclease
MTRPLAGLAYNPRVAEYFCYMIECADGTFYTGWTTDPERRLKQHQSGNGARYTRTRRPLRLAYVEPQPDISAAIRREKAIKALPRKKKLSLIASQPEVGLPSQ